MRLRPRSDVVVRGGRRHAPVQRADVVICEYDSSTTVIRRHRVRDHRRIDLLPGEVRMSATQVRREDLFRYIASSAS